MNNDFGRKSRVCAKYFCKSGHTVPGIIDSMNVSFSLVLAPRIYTPRRPIYLLTTWIFPCGPLFQEDFQSSDFIAIAIGFELFFIKQIFKSGTITMFITKFEDEKPFVIYLVIVGYKEEVVIAFVLK